MIKIIKNMITMIMKTIMIKIIKKMIIIDQIKQRYNNKYNYKNRKNNYYNIIKRTNSNKDNEKMN